MAASSFRPEGGLPPFRFVARPAVLIPVDACGVSGLLNLPGLDAHTPADLGQEHIQRLFKGVAAMPLSKEQELPYQAHEVGLVLRKRQILFPQELGISVQCGLQAFSTHGYNGAPCLYANSDIIRFPMLW